MKCPTCDIDLERTDYEEQSVFQCPQCSGYMADLQHITLIKETRQKSEQQLADEGQAWPRRDDSKPIRCPRCHSKMQIVRINEDAEDHDEVLLDECDLCHAAWFDPGELPLMQLDYQSVQDTIRKKQEAAMIKSRPKPEESSGQTSEEDIPAENARVMIDVLSLIGITFAGALCYLFKAYDFDFFAGIAFAIVTFIAAWTAERFLEESGGKQFVVATFVTCLGLIVSYLVWIY